MQMRGRSVDSLTDRCLNLKISISSLLSIGFVRSDESTSHRPCSDVANEKQSRTKGQIRRFADVLGHQKAVRNVLETHVLTELHSSSVASRGGPWPFSRLCAGTPTLLPTLSFSPHSSSRFIHSSVNKGV